MGYCSLWSHSLVLVLVFPPSPPGAGPGPLPFPSQGPSPPPMLTVSERNTEMVTIFSFLICVFTKDGLNEIFLACRTGDAGVSFPVLRFRGLHFLGGVLQRWGEPVTINVNPICHPRPSDPLFNVEGCVAPDF